MQQIQRKSTHTQSIAMPSRITVPGDLPDSVTPRSSEETRIFWNAVIDKTVELLRDRPHCIPMSSGYATVNRDSRERLGPNDTRVVTAGQRAYVMLRLLGERKSRVAEMDHWHAKEFRLACALWFDLYPIVHDGVNIAHESLPDERWAVMLAALLVLAHASVGFVPKVATLPVLYEQAIVRCKAGGPIDLVALSTRTSLQAQALDDRSVEAQWVLANLALSNRGLAPAMLGRLTLRVLCQRLFITLPGSNVTNRLFFSQWLEWMHTLNATETIACLGRLKPFGGPEKLDPGDGYPAIFRPYQGMDAPALSAFEALVDPAERPHVVAAYLQAVRVVDRLLDLPAARTNAGPRGHGFNWQAYNYLRGRINGSRDDMKSMFGPDDARSATFAECHERLRLQRFLDEMKRDDERTILHATGALQCAIDNAASPPPTPSPSQARSAA